MSTPTDALAEKQPTLPLKDDLLNSKIRSDAMAACLGIFDKLRSKEGSVARGIFQAGMQLLAHVTRDLEVRSRFREMNGPQRILHLGTSYSCMPGLNISSSPEKISRSIGTVSMITLFWLLKVL